MNGRGFCILSTKRLLFVNTETVTMPTLQNNNPVSYLIGNNYYSEIN